MKHSAELTVMLGGRIVGLLLQGDRGKLYFQYDSNWLRDGFDLAPGTMAFVGDPQLAKTTLFGGLHGVFSDSLPDGWGLLLMDRTLRAKAGWTRADITILDRLAYIGERAMGAIEYRPASWIESTSELVDLGALAKQAEAVLVGEESEVLAQLRILGGSPGGARPKVTVARNSTNGECRAGFADVPDGYEHWLVKFRSQEDPVDAGRVERAYAEMAVGAGLRMETTDLIETSIDGRAEVFFATRRFDRAGADKRHFISLSGYLYADHRMPSVEYESVLGATMKLCRDMREVEHAFRLAVFNVLAHNKDDHTKNFAFVYEVASRQWNISPPFDLTFSQGISGEHTTAINGSGNPSRDHLLKLAKQFNITRASAIIDEVRASIASWSAMATKWGVSARTGGDIGEALSRIDKRN